MPQRTDRTMIKFKILKGTDGSTACRDFRKAILSDECRLLDEPDGNDEKAFHIIGVENGEIICCGRLYKTGDYVYCIDKTAVRACERKQYVGDTVIRALEDRAVSEMGAIIMTSVPQNAWQFFEHEGYLPVGEEYTENGILYKTMKRDLTKIRGCRGGQKK